MSDYVLCTLTTQLDHKIHLEKLCFSQVTNFSKFLFYVLKEAQRLPIFVIAIPSLSKEGEAISVRSWNPWERFQRYIVVDRHSPRMLEDTVDTNKTTKAIWLVAVEILTFGAALCLAGHGLDILAKAIVVAGQLIVIATLCALRSEKTVGSHRRNR